MLAAAKDPTPSPFFEAPTLGCMRGNQVQKMSGTMRLETAHSILESWGELAYRYKES